MIIKVWKLLYTALHNTALVRHFVCIVCIKRNSNSKLSPHLWRNEWINTHTYIILLTIFRMSILHNRWLTVWFAPFVFSFYDDRNRYLTWACVLVFNMDIHSYTGYIRKQPGKNPLISKSNQYSLSLSSFSHLSHDLGKSCLSHMLQQINPQSLPSGPIADQRCFLNCDGKRSE